MATNPIILTIPAGSKAIIQAVSNAAWNQQLTIDWGQGPVVLAGSGERVPMTTPDGRTTLEVAPSPQGYQVNVTFQFSQEPSGPFLLGRVQEPIITQKGPFSVVQVMSEDGSDNDNNDTYLTLVAVNFGQDMVVSPPTTNDSEVSSTPAAAFDESLHTHAKTYYNNPLVIGGDEHYFTVPGFNLSGRVDYQGTSWSARNAMFLDVPTPFGGYLNIYAELYDCQHPEMHDLVVLLTTSIGYWGFRPVGSRSADWVWSVTGTGPYTVTQVTD